MITDNAKKRISETIMGLIAKSYNYSFLTRIPIVDIRGNTQYLMRDSGTYKYPCEADPKLTLSVTTSGICVGSGTTPPQGTDYKLEDMITSGISSTITYKVDNVEIDGATYLCKQYILSLSNTSSTDITISEIGQIGAVSTVNAPNYTSSGTVSYILVDRTLLDEPITLAPTDSATIVYNVYADISLT